jgi:hypothetical protein
MLKAAKVSGLEHNDIAEFIRFGGSPGTFAGCSGLLKFAVLAAQKRTGLDGALSGTFLRALSGYSVAPTPTRLGALADIGINYDDFAATKARVTTKTRIAEAYDAKPRWFCDRVGDIGDRVSACPRTDASPPAPCSVWPPPPALRATPSRRGATTLGGLGSLIKGGGRAAGLAAPGDSKSGRGGRLAGTCGRRGSGSPAASSARQASPTTSTTC